MSKLFLSGNEAIARGAYAAGCHVAAAYPGTPSTEILENIAKFKGEIDCEWSVNEKVAMEIAIGASIAGARALVCMKHVGLNVAMDPLMTYTFEGTNGGLVVVSADDPEDYQPETAYWRGVVWPPTDYIAFRGLLDCGESAFAEDAARSYYNGVAAIYEKTGTVWENSSPEQCEKQKTWAGEDFCGWGALAPVALPVEFGWI